MPYEWTKKPNSQTSEQLDLWPFSSLPHRGFASFIMTTFVLITLPLYVLIGTILFWALLPFLMITVGAICFAIRKNFRDRSIIERLTLDANNFIFFGRGEWRTKGLGMQRLLGACSYA